MPETRLKNTRAIYPELNGTVRPSWMSTGDSPNPLFPEGFYPTSDMITPQWVKDELAKPESAFTNRPFSALADALSGLMDAHEHDWRYTTRPLGDTGMVLTTRQCELCGIVEGLKAL